MKLGMYSVTFIYIVFLHVLKSIHCEIEFIENGMCDVVREKIILEIFKV